MSAQWGSRGARIAALGLSMSLAVPGVRAQAQSPVAKPAKPTAAVKPAAAGKPGAKPAPAAAGKPSPAAQKVAATSPGMHATGLKLASDVSYKRMDKRHLAFSAGAEEPPRSIDLSSELPPPGDQGAQGSCTAWAVGYGLKSYLAKVTNKWELASNAGVDYSHVFSPAFVYSSTKTTENGISLSEVLSFIRDRGVSTWADFPYDPKNAARAPEPRVQSEATRWRIKSWQALRVAQLDVRQQISQRRPVVIGAEISRDFKNGKLEPGAMWKKAGDVVEAHAMLLVGYDDDKRAFKLMNSWGKNWGQGGFAWLSYDLFPKVVREAYVATDYAPEETPTPIALGDRLQEAAAHDVGHAGDEATEDGVALPAESGPPRPPRSRVPTGPVAPIADTRPVLVGFKISAGDVLGSITPIFRDQIMKDGVIAYSHDTRTGAAIGSQGGGGATVLRDGSYVVALRIKVGDYFGARHVLSFQADFRNSDTGAIQSSDWYGSGANATDISEPIEVRPSDGAFISGFDGTSLTHTSGETFVSTVDIVETSRDWYK